MDAFIPILQHYRFYNDDGSEWQATAITDEDENNHNIDIDFDVIIHLRVLIEEAGAGSVGGGAADTWELQYQVNGTGGWSDVTASSSRVQASASTHLTDGGVTINRSSEGLTDPSGPSYQQGRQEESDGSITFQHSADVFTEHHYCIKIISADSSHTDWLKFRVSYNGGSPGMTHNVDPHIVFRKGLRAAIIS
jgi:hypothetical protein